MIHGVVTGILSNPGDNSEPVGAIIRARVGAPQDQIQLLLLANAWVKIDLIFAALV